MPYLTNTVGTVSDKNHSHQPLAYHIPYFTYFFSELILVLITAQTTESVQPVCPFQAGYTVSVTSIGKEKPVIFRIVKPTVAVQITGTVI